ncbi:7016_t:CDS:1, partial [Acaulospora morrowiae]
MHESPAKLSRKELRLEGIMNELSVDVMEDIIMSNDASTDNVLFPESLQHLCRKVCKQENQTISCYYKFGKALKDRLDEFIEKKHVNARETLSKEVCGNFPPGTSPNLVKKKMEKARKIYDLFSVIGENKIQRVRSFSVDAISSLTKDEI